MPPRFAMQGPDPYPVPTPAGPNPYVPPTTVPADSGGAGPVFGGGQEQAAPLVGVGRSTTQGVGRRDVSRDPRDWRDTAVEGFDTQPADRVLQSLFDIPKPELRALQMKLYDAGFYGNVSKDAVVFGVVDDVTWKAFGDLLDMSAQYYAADRQMTWYEVLDEVQQLRKEQGTNLLDNQGPKRAPFVARTTNADDIERVSQQVAASLVGENVDPALVKRIISQYHATEVSSQRQAYDAAQSGGTVTEAPALDTFAEQAIRQADPTAVTAYTAADSVLGAFEQIVAGPFG